MLHQLRPAIVLFVVLTLVTGVLYPLAVTVIAQTAFARQADGSLIVGADGAVRGSSLIGQDFSTGDPKGSARWFWGRPSATGPVPYTAFNLRTSTGSSGSNLAPTNPALVENARAGIAALRAAEAAAGLEPSPPGVGLIPVELVTSSASGLDPHISPAAAEYQVARVARARGLAREVVRALVRHHTTDRVMGILGEPVVNVLELNLALERTGR